MGTNQPEVLRSGTGAVAGAARPGSSGAPRAARPERARRSALPFQVVVRGRHTGVPRRFRDAVEGKLERLVRLRPRVMRVDVELSRERNPRQADTCDHVEITLIRTGPVLRAAAAAPEACAALDGAVDKLAEQLRRDADRRHSRGSRVPRPAAVPALGAGGS